MLPAFLIVLALLAAVAAATWEGEPADEPPTPLRTVASRVEGLRGLRFDALPSPVRVTAERATQEGLADYDRAFPAARRGAEEAMYERLGLLPPGTDLRKVTASVFGEQVAGYYDPRDGRLRVVEGTASGNRALDEMVLAHELVHALEDQAIGLDVGLAEEPDDRGYAYRALVEGTATHAMVQYVDRHLGTRALDDLLAGSLAGSGTTALPPFVMQALLFPYLEGRAFVAALEERGGWRLLDAALRVRPPRSTEQVLHVEKWLRGEAPERLRSPRDARLGEPDVAGTFGEWQTLQLLGSDDAARRAAEGWGGDAYASWGGATALRWAGDTRRDARELRRALTALVRSGRLRGAAAVGPGRRTVTLAVAEDPATARRLAGTD